MTIVVKRKLTKKEKEKIINSATQRVKPIDVSKYKGKFKWDGNPLKMQKKWRDE